MSLDILFELGRRLCGKSVMPLRYAYNGAPQICSMLYQIAWNPFL